MEIFGSFLIKVKVNFSIWHNGDEVRVIQMDIDHIPRIGEQVWFDEDVFKKENKKSRYSIIEFSKEVQEVHYDYRDQNELNYIWIRFELTGNSTFSIND